MQPGSCYLGIQLTEYLLTALEIVTYQKAGTCRLEILGYTGRTTVLTMATCELFLVSMLCEKFSKRKAPTVLDTTVMGGLETSNVERRARLMEKPLEEDSRSSVLSSPSEKLNFTQLTVGPRIKIDVPLHKPSEEFIFRRRIIGAPAFSISLCGGIQLGVNVLRNSTGYKLS
ncbi:hypothetical protein C2G38_2220327 [Gigaspora rosea]|uniref:Uncharacterized protein n=1 Tax=Gigaspora rosea TaxID=44941 RepID=A0A397U8W7_9GLOM|nr:hypothetical protein C2G38_2220327 [Gigaspora rosea]